MSPTLSQGSPNWPSELGASSSSSVSHPFKKYTQMETSTRPIVERKKILSRLNQETTKHISMKETRKALNMAEIPKIPVINKKEKENAAIAINSSLLLNSLSLFFLVLSFMNLNSFSSR